MKKSTLVIFIGFVLLGTSCKKYLDINTNTNASTITTPELVLPQALTATASVLNSYNSYGSQMGAYAANSEGYGGFGETFNYNFSSGTFTNLWTNTYDNLEDYQYILDQSNTDEYSYFNAAARIMKVYDFQLLVDTYNKIPYSDALHGSDFLTPKYDDAATIYVSLANQLDSAMKTINRAMALNAAGTTVKDLGSHDVLFGGNEKNWLQFANTIKLRLLVRATGKATFSNTSFDSTGFLTTDALINPGFTQDNNKQNPAWNNWAFSYTGGGANKVWIPSTFVFGFYDGHKLTDSARGRAIYYTFTDSVSNGISNQLGFGNLTIPKCPTGSFWYSGTDRTVSAGNQIGILKGPDAGLPAMLAAESYFLQAEAVVRGILPATTTAKTLFNNGITASFNYLYLLPNGKLGDKILPADSATAYIAKNASSYLVNFDLANSIDKKTEAIITQKFIALNYISSQEGWFEYCRTQYPTSTAGGNGYESFASISSESTRADKLPTRIMYPVSESLYNPTNVPSGISPFSSLIFWAK